MIDWKPSKTATLIAKSVVLQAADPRRQPLIDSGVLVSCEQSLLSLGASGRVFLSLVQFRLFRKLVYFLEWCMLPGIQLHYLARKKYIYNLLKDAVESGVDQIVILGAGCDGLSQRIVGEKHTLKVFDVDHPATMGGADVKGRDNAIVRVPSKLDESGLAERLYLAGFDRSLKTIVVAEGVLMYLSKGEVGSLLIELSHLADERPAIIFTYIDCVPRADISFKNSHKLVTWWLKRSDEPFRSGSDASSLRCLLGEASYRIHKDADHKVLANEVLKFVGLADEVLAIGERVVLAY